MAVTVDADKCTGCGACKDICPMEAISMVNNRVVIGESCVECGACIPVCPNNALAL